MNAGKVKFHAKPSREQKPKLTVPQEPKEIVHFEFYAPEARAVSLAGSFNAWDAAASPMKKIGNATWAVDLELMPGRHEYRLVVDGRWQEDPNAAQQTDNPYGGKNSVLLID